MLAYHPLGSYGLSLIAKDGKLIEGSLGDDCGGSHTFFDTPEETEAPNQAYAAYLAQIRLESEAYRINLAIETGNDVFLTEHVDRSWMTEDPNERAEALKRMALPSQEDEIRAQMGQLPERKLQLTAKVTEVIHGDLTPGTTLTFSGEQCQRSYLDKPPTVFLHLPDSRMLRPFSQGGDLYLTVSRNTLGWYQSLTEAQIEDLKTRYLARLAQRMRESGQAE